MVTLPQPFLWESAFLWRRLPSRHKDLHSLESIPHGDPLNLYDFLKPPNRLHEIPADKPFYQRCFCLFLFYFFITVHGVQQPASSHHWSWVNLILLEPTQLLLIWFPLILWEKVFYPFYLMHFYFSYPILNNSGEGSQFSSYSSLSMLSSGFVTFRYEVLERLFSKYMSSYLYYSILWK